MIDKYISVVELADYWQVSINTIYRLIYTHQLSYLTIGQAIRFKPEYIEQYENQCNENTYKLKKMEH